MLQADPSSPSVCVRSGFGCKLPAEIYHFPSERPPEGSPLVQEANELGATLVEAKGTVKDPKRRKNYHLKVRARPTPSPRRLLARG